MSTRAIVLVVLLIASVACISSTPGGTRTSADNPLVTIGAGRAEVGPANYYYVWYVIDKRTQTCWMKLGDAGAQLDCCALRRVSEAQPYITWATCPDDAQPSQANTPAGPARDAGTPAPDAR
jgi:hypothetical protein